MPWPKGKKRGPRKRPSPPIPVATLEAMKEALDKYAGAMERLGSPNKPEKKKNHTYGRRRVAAANAKEG